MKVKLFKLVQSVEQLSMLSGAKFQAGTTLKIMRIMRAVRPEIEDYDKVRNELITKYGELEENGNTTVKQDKIKEFLDEMNPVLEEEVDLAIDPLKVSELTIELSANDLERLEWLLLLDE